MRFWRPLADVADIICGEGSVAELPIHTHQALQVMLPASRFTVVHGQSSAVVVQPGQVHVAAPLELHGARGIDGEPCAMRVILVAPALLGRRHAEVQRLAAGLRQLVVDDPALYAELWAIVDDLRGPLVGPSCAPRLLTCLGNLIGGLPAPPPPAPKSGAGVARHVAGVARVCDYLRAHVTKSISLDELASMACLSKFYLLRAFRRVHGITPHVYQMQLRLAQAWRFIVEGSPLSTATYDAGFADQSHLTRRFAAVFGLTPARYARQLAVPPGAAPSISGIERFAASQSAA